MELSFKGKKIFAFADTHGWHRMIRVSDDTDILICAGDAVEDNLQGNEYDDFLDWFSIQPGKHKIFVPGNHELSFDIGVAENVRPLFERRGIILMEDAVDDFDGIATGAISGNGRIADEDIPEDLDILVTHYPPFGILDDGFGSPEILNFVLKVQPRYHLFGHIHRTGGLTESGRTNYVNISEYETLCHQCSGK